MPNGPSTLLRKRTTHPKTVSMQFEELAACLSGQYTGIRLVNRLVTIEGEAFRQMLTSARSVSIKNADFYVLDIP